MNFVQAAIHLLREADAPMSVEDLARLAVERELLSRPGKDPLRSMKTRLTTEAKKGDDSAVVKVDDGVWALRNGDGAAAAPPALERPRRSRARRPRREPPAPDPQLDAVLAPPERPVRVDEPAAPDEGEAAELYGDELAGTEPGAAHAEYRDEQTKDEDRPMLPEITARRGRRERRRRDRDRKRRKDDRKGRSRRDRGNGEARARGGAEPAEAKKTEAKKTEAKKSDAQKTDAKKAEPAEAPRRSPLEPRGDVAPYRAGNAMGDAAEETLSELKDRQPVQVKQLAQMMRKRKLLDGNPNEMWPHLKAALLQDAQSFREHGLRPRIVYRGRDLFVLTRYALADEVRQAEVEIGQAVDHLAAATHRALMARLSAMDTRSLERVVHTYLVRTGWREIQWIKHVGRSSYATGRPVGALGPVLVGVRAGDEPVDRRGVGELRAGVAAKDLRNGLLLAPQPLSEEAHREMERGGRAISVLCGDAFITALIEAGVAVRKSTAPVVLLDEQFLDEVE